jgi:hypothetical protein
MGRGGKCAVVHADQISRQSSAVREGALLVVPAGPPAPPLWAFPLPSLPPAAWGPPLAAPSPTNGQGKGDTRMGHVQLRYALD